MYYRIVLTFANYLAKILSFVPFFRIFGISRIFVILAIITDLAKMRLFLILGILNVL